VAVDRVARCDDRDRSEHEHPEEDAERYARMLDRLREVDVLRLSLRFLRHGDAREGSANADPSLARCGVVHLGRTTVPHVVARTVAAPFTAR
jgi:hypothetical protein